MLKKKVAIAVINNSLLGVVISNPLLQCKFLYLTIISPYVFSSLPFYKDIPCCNEKWPLLSGTN